MMKKGISILLALALLLGCCAALGESAERKTEMGTLDVNGSFTIQCAVPEEYDLSIQYQDTACIVGTLSSRDAAKPTVGIQIFFSEEWADIDRLNDVSEDGLRMIEATFREMDDVKFEYAETGLGTKLMKVTEADGAADFIDIYTIYKGYELEFIMRAGTEPLTEKSGDMLIDFITQMDFVENTASTQPAAAGMLTGGWTAAADPAVTEEVRALVDRALADTEGFEFVPAAYLGSQVVAGVNHAVLGEGRPTNENTVPSWKILYLYEDLNGNVTLMNIADFNFGALCTYGSAD